LHLLLGLLEEDEGRAADLVRAAGLTWEAYESWRGPLPASDSPAGTPLATASLVLLRQARNLAVELTGEGTVSSEPLLLALLGGGESRLAAELAALGFRLDRLEALLAERKPPPVSLEEPLRLVEPTESIDTARILDAAGNRAREALRVVEDYCRFVLDDAVLSAELKGLAPRPSRGCWRSCPPGRCWRPARRSATSARPSARPDEHHRASLADVIEANLKRPPEALRSLEEYGKVVGPSLGARGRTAPLPRLHRGAAPCCSAPAARTQLKDARLYVLLTGQDLRGEPGVDDRPGRRGRRVGHPAAREGPVGPRPAGPGARRAPLDAPGRRALHRQRPPRHRPPGRGRRRPPGPG